jgi:CubicO group peptidase (beta-lactamase class C family)
MRVPVILTLATATVAASLAVNGFAGSAAARPESTSAASTYRTCAALWKAYPTGVARDAKARTAAVSAGNRAPRVSAAVYRANRARLDKDGDGVVCPRKAPGTPPPAVSDPIVPENPAYAATANAVRAAGATCMVVRKGDQVVGEWYWDGRTPATATTGFSTMKALTGTLIGIAQTQGLLNIDQKASDFIAEWKGTPSENVTIRQLLTMTSGRATSPMDAQSMLLSGNATQYAIGLGQAAPPGTVFALSDSAPQALARVLTAATGKAVIPFAQESLLTPLGMSSTTLVPDGANAANMAFNYTTTCRDLAKLSQLYVNGGSWQGRQVLSADYTAQARTGSPVNGGYGFLFNLNTPGTGTYDPGAPANAFSFVGDCGQVTSAFPSSGTVISVMTSNGLFDALTCDPGGAKVSAISQALAGASG